MYIKFKENTQEISLNKIKKFIEERKLGVLDIEDNGIRKFGILGNQKLNLKEELLNNQEIKDVIDDILEISVPYKFSSREFKKSDTVIKVKDVEIGGDDFVLIGGPCSVENREMVMKIAKEIKKNGGKILRGGAFKPRTSPYDFQGLEEEGLIYMREACDKYGLILCTEIMDGKNIDMICKYADILQVGTRNMQNFSLLKDLGKVDKPILLKRGMSATITEFLMAVEYLIAYGNKNIILCERGIRTFERMTRNTIDINAIALIKEICHFPILIDASHGTGIRNLVEPITLAGIMAGANGCMIEVHENPCCALSDGAQTLDFQQFKSTSKKIFKTFEFKKNL
ncbi:MAG: 3-deoxy-7-phosphoheptulonate synthase [Fusobacterium perfoetens]|uniref:3-deoxy-7-phosphoheptulonate synthase n=1 Tax=Fusobacterium perfoetens TaxID=852 RepID=UPI0023EFDF84|nr:3-deoxy-7-phosphoheptulonate synthase [Fusobacterium perfoetens]MCI6152723.1 3-deoxy-7-phosphoheptulonate synthase [Fusobacterium perfoetens]MDY3236617.1 3-deoxy-7-phosphoheptulonate synthase [Fusobacterium perfoetens]